MGMFNTSKKKIIWPGARNSINVSSRSNSPQEGDYYPSKKRFVKLNMPTSFPSAREKELGHRIHSRIVDIRSSRNDLSNKSLKRLIREF